MFTEALYISITGMGVVFSFLFIIFLVLKGLKFFAVEETEKNTKTMVSNKETTEVKDEISTAATEKEISPEVIAAILAAVKKYKPITGKKIKITKK